MVQKKEDPYDRKWLIALVVAIIGASGGAGGGTWLYLSNAGVEQLQAITRPDPFTGAQGTEIKRELDRLTTEVGALEKRVAQLPPRELEQGIALLAREVELLRDEINRHSLTRHND